MSESSSSECESSFGSVGDSQCESLFNREKEGLEVDNESDNNSERSLEYLYDHLSYPLTPTARLLVKTTVKEMKRFLEPEIRSLQEKARKYDFLKQFHSVEQEEKPQTPSLESMLAFDSGSMATYIEASKILRDRQKSHTNPEDYVSFPDPAFDNSVIHPATPDNTRDSEAASPARLEAEVLDELFLDRAKHDHATRSLEGKLRLLLAEDEFCTADTTSASSSVSTQRSSLKRLFLNLKRNKK